MRPWTNAYAQFTKTLGVADEEAGVDLRAGVDVDAEHVGRLALQ